MVEEIVLLIDKNISEGMKKHVKQLFSKVKVDEYRYIVISYIAYFHFRRPRPQALYPITVSVMAGFFKKAPKELDDPLNFDVEVIPQ